MAADEIVWSRREQPDGLQNASGFFVSGDYQFGFSNTTSLIIAASNGFPLRGGE